MRTLIVVIPALLHPESVVPNHFVSYAALELGWLLELNRIVMTGRYVPERGVSIYMMVVIKREVYL